MTETSQAILEYISRLPRQRQLELAERAKYATTMPFHYELQELSEKRNVRRQKHRVFVDEFVVDLNWKRASVVAGLKNNPLCDGYVRDLVEIKLAERSLMTELKAEYVRDYIFNVLEFCPTDYFSLAPDGDWCIDPESFKTLPQPIKRLVESVEFRQVAGRKYLSVKFVSKSAALAMAARYTLTQQIAATVTTVPWEELTRMAQVETDDELDRRLLGVNGHSQLTRPVRDG